MTDPVPSAQSPSIVDAHVAVGQLPHFDMMGAEDLLREMDAHGVQRAMLGPVGRWLAVDNAESNATLASWAQLHAGRLGYYAVASPWLGKRAEAELRSALEAGAKGWKVVPNVQGVGLLSPLLEPLLDIAQEMSRPVYVTTGVPVACEPLQLAELALRRPGLTFIMGRSGRTDFALDLLPTLDTGSNIVAETAYNGPELIAGLVGRFGAERVLFASDMPFNDLTLELDRLGQTDLATRDRESVMSGTAADLFGWQRRDLGGPS